jgi:solute carrier family 25 citrate transporter 1
MTKVSQEPIKIRSDPPTDEELYAWTMRKEAVASCLIEDILHLQPNPAKSAFPGLILAIFCDTSPVDYDFNWLGRVPCRSVKVVGMVIGIKDYESKRIYTSTGLFSSACLDLHV